MCFMLPPVCQNCDQNVLKMNKWNLVQISTRGSRVNEMKRTTFVISRSKVKIGMSIKHIHKIPTGSPLSRVLNIGGHKNFAIFDQ